MCWPRLVHDDDEEEDIANGEYFNTPFITAPAMVQSLGLHRKLWGGFLQVKRRWLSLPGLPGIIIVVV